MPHLLIALGLTLFGMGVEKFTWRRGKRFDDLFNLPNAPGVYILYGKYNKIIHIGSASNLKNRPGKAHEKRNQVVKFDWKRCSTYPDAYQLEMKLQRQHGYKGR